MKNNEEEKEDVFDRLSYMFVMQEVFENTYFENLGLDLGEIKSTDFEHKVDLNKEFILSLIKESSELLDNINWKNHTYQSKAFIKDNFAESCIDVLKYLFILCIINGIDDNDLYEKFNQKTAVVESKFKQKQLLLDLKSGKIKKKIAIVDIDGVLAKYPDKINEFIKIHTQGKYTNIKDLKFENLSLYERIKREYRLSGQKRFIPLMPNAKNFTTNLHKNGYFVLLLTARPYEQISRIYYDTMSWLNDNDIYFDAIIWDRNKSEFAVENLSGCNIALCIDDDIENAKNLSRLSKVYLVDNPLNESARYNALPKNITVIKNLKQVKEAYEK